MKLNITSYLMLGMLALACTGIYADADEQGSVGPGAIKVNVKAVVQVLNCFGDGNINCNQNSTLNSIGAPFNVDVRTAQFTDLGTITSSTNRVLAIPSYTDGNTLYKFTNGMGEITYLGIEMKPAPKPGSLYATQRTPSGKTLMAGKDYNVFEIYRYANGQWRRNNVVMLALGTRNLEIQISPQGATRVVEERVTTQQDIPSSSIGVTRMPVAV